MFDEDIFTMFDESLNMMPLDEDLALLGGDESDVVNELQYAVLSS